MAISDSVTILRDGRMAKELITAETTPEELSALREKCGAAVFFSEELCANYFSYTAQGRAHFVLFDTAETLRCKLRLGRERGIETAFLMYPEVSDLLPELLNA